MSDTSTRLAPSLALPPYPCHRHLPMIALVTVALALIALAGAYWKSSTGPYLKAHPLAWQLGAPLIAIALFFLGKKATVYRRDQEWAHIQANST